jgi:hypothetical protein
MLILGSSPPQRIQFFTIGELSESHMIELPEDARLSRMTQLATIGFDSPEPEKIPPPPAPSEMFSAMTEFVIAGLHP